MKKIFVKFALSFVVIISTISCTKHTMVDPVPIDELISEYITNGKLDVYKFNKENSEHMIIREIKNTKDSLEFILVYKNSEVIEYYKNGNVITYTPIDNKK